MTHEELEQVVLSQGSSLTKLDNLIRNNKNGRLTVLGFRCNHSGLYFPADYVKNWGRGYGSGLGPSPVSETLDSDYETAPPALTGDIRNIEQIMHPLVVTKAQIDLMDVDEQDFKNSQLVLAVNDPYLEKRARIIRPKQLINPRGTIRLLQAKFESVGR